MTPPPRRRGAAQGNVLLGIWRCARGRRDGLAQFGATPEAFIASFGPLVAFPLVAAMLATLRGGGQTEWTYVLAFLCVLLANAVLSHGFARFWLREAAWPRFATAMNWCAWVPQIGLVLAMLAAGTLQNAGVPPDVAVVIPFGAVALYALWLQWFVARHGLAIGGWRAALLVAGVNIGASMVVYLPEWLLHRAGIENMA
jgi:hypothetical protein